jgi:phosphate transport system substrate-binding protein
MQRSLLALLLAAAFSAPGFIAEVQAADLIRINGSGSALDVLKPLIQAYARVHPQVTIEMEKPLGSSGAIKALLAGALDIAVSSKPLKPEEVAQGCRGREYGRMPLALVTAKGVAKSDITTRELEDIYSGKVRTWPNGEAIRLVLRPDADIDTAILRGLSQGMDSALSAARKSPGMTVAVTDPESNTAVASIPGALGASGLSSLLVGKLPLNTLSLNGVKPTAKALSSGAYPLAKEVRFVTTERLPPIAQKFINFAYSSQGRSIASRAGLLVVDNDKPVK